MALIECPECGNMVSDSASSCPRCGYSFTKTKFCKYCGEKKYQRIALYALSAVGKWKVSVKTMEG